MSYKATSPSSLLIINHTSSLSGPLLSRVVPHRLQRSMRPAAVTLTASSAGSRHPSLPTCAHQRPSMIQTMSAKRTGRRANSQDSRLVDVLAHRNQHGHPMQCLRFVRRINATTPASPALFYPGAVTSSSVLNASVASTHGTPGRHGTRCWCFDTVRPRPLCVAPA